MASFKQKLADMDNLLAGFLVTQCPWHLETLIPIILLELDREVTISLGIQYSRKA
jgi:hypothetical protein